MVYAARFQHEFDALTIDLPAHRSILTALGGGEALRRAGIVLP
jgi:hypothetical protein